MVKLDGTTVLITGGSSGLGRSMSIALAEAGASVFIVATDGSGIAEMRELIGKRCNGEVADVSKESDVVRAVTNCISTFGGIDVVINNAGVGMIEIRRNWTERPVRFWEVDSADVQRFFSVHTLGSFHVAKHALPYMVEKGWGRVITVTTSLDTMTRGGQSPYGPVKASSEAFASVMAYDLAGTGVTSNVLIPGGATDTQMVPDSIGVQRSTLLRPEIMGPPAVWLASRSSDEVTAKRVVASEWDSALPSEECIGLAVHSIAWSSDRSLGPT